MGKMTDVERGQQLAAMRNDAGLTQAQVGAAFGINKQAVSEWETGKSAPDRRRLMALDGLYRGGGRVLALYDVDLGAEFVTRAESADLTRTVLELRDELKADMRSLAAEVQELLGQVRRLVKDATRQTQVVLDAESEPTPTAPARSGTRRPRPQVQR